MQNIEELFRKYTDKETFSKIVDFNSVSQMWENSINTYPNNEAIVDVYLAKIPISDNFSAVFPPDRQNEIESITSEKVKREKYYAWKLLEYGLLNTFNKKITDINFEKQTTGKWSCNACEFSISHSNNVVCVAISKSPVGVDIEKIQPTPIDISKEILSKEELNDYNALNSDKKTSFIISAWTKKESLFKQKNVKRLSREEFRNLTGIVSKKTIYIGNDIYSLSIATDATDKIRIYEGINL